MLLCSLRKLNLGQGLRLNRPVHSKTVGKPVKQRVDIGIAIGFISPFLFVDICGALINSIRFINF